MAFLIKKSLAPKYPYWHFYDTDDEPTASSIWKVEFGRIVLCILNQINAIKGNDSVDDVPNDLKLTEASELNGAEEDWMKLYDDLLKIIVHRQETDIEQLYEYYLQYKAIAFYLLNGDKFESQNNKKNKFRYSNPIRMIGYEVEDNIPYEVFFVNDYEDYFELDLFELLFNPNTSIYVKRCSCCNVFFRAENNKIRYCSDECRTNGIKNKNKEYCKRLTYKLKKSIREMIERNTTVDDGFRNKLLYAFLNEYDYYHAIIYSKFPPTSCPEHYRDDIKTEDDFIAWLNKKKSEIKNCLNNEAKKLREKRRD